MTGPRCSHCALFGYPRHELPRAEVRAHWLDDHGQPSRNLRPVCLNCYTTRYRRDRLCYYTPGALRRLRQQQETERPT